MIKKLDGYPIFKNIDGLLYQTGYSNTAKLDEIHDKINEIIDYINSKEDE